MEFKRVELTYELDALEPYISKKTMDAHYNHHHAGYEKGLNDALDGYDLPDNVTLDQLVANYPSLQKELHVPVRQFGGGLINHNFFFQILKKNTTLKDPDLLKEIRDVFGSVKKLEEKLLEAAMKVFGSGWAWLVIDSNNKMRIYNTFNQDTPWFLNMKPLIGIDVWEHAYYLDYKYDRKTYVKQFFNVINWEKVSQLYHEYQSKINQ